MFTEISHHVIAGRISLNGCAFALRDPKSGSRGRLVEADSCSKTLALIAAVFDLLRYWNSVWLHCTALFSKNYQPALLRFYLSSLCRPQPRLRRRSLPPNPSIYILHSFQEPSAAALPTAVTCCTAHGATAPSHLWCPVNVPRSGSLRPPITFSALFVSRFNNNSSNKQYNLSLSKMT